MRGPKKESNIKQKSEHNLDLEKGVKYSKKTIRYSKRPLNLGRMNDPDGSAYIRGLCGDTMEIYLLIKDDVVTGVNFFTDGCGVTLACGSAITEMAKGKNIYDLVKLSPQDIIDNLGGLPREGIHCAILSVN
ncbi:MAG: iron-sulfur cluster assembly scaffold protein, partial [Spirochaetes bacterium]|nr:iron-sulfur cluster assembly scaffold protein [Spirochaetota bacterium]